MRTRFQSLLSLGSIFGSVLLLLGGAIAGTCFAQNHTVQPADIADLKRIEQPMISPDGSMVAYSVITSVAGGKPSNEHIWIVRANHPGSSRLFVAGSRTDTAPAWSPDGRHLAFLSDRPNPMASPGSPFHFSLVPGQYPADIPKDLIEANAAQTAQQGNEVSAQSTPHNGEIEEKKETRQLWWISMDGGEGEPLTNLPGNIRSFKWSRSGKYIAFIRTDAETPVERERNSKKDDRHIIDAEYHFDRLWIYDFETHQARLLTHQDANIDSIDWSPDDTSIVARVSPTPRLDDYWRVSVVEIFDASTGAVRQVVEQHSGYLAPVYSPDGTMIAYSHMTEKRITDMHLVRILKTGQDIKLEDKLHGTVSEVLWMPANKLLVNAYVGAHTEAHILDAGSLAVTAVEGLPPKDFALDVSKDGGKISFLSETSRRPAEISVAHDGKVQVLTSTNPQTREWLLGDQREVHWTNPKDHRIIYGVLTLPPGYTQGKRYKTVIHLHGGPEEAYTVGFSANWYNYALLLASQGYVVLQPNYRGSAGQTIDFTQADYRDWGGGDFEDVMAGVDWLVGQGIADPDRMFIAGWSYGGYLAAWAVTHTDRFKAAVAGAPITDIYSMAVTTDIAPSYLNSYMGNYAASLDGPDELDRQSPIRYAINCHTPVLILQGEADTRVPLTQGQEFYHALRFLGRDAEMVTYPREPHIFTEQQHQIDSLTRELDWFSQYLSPPSTQGG